MMKSTNRLATILLGAAILGMTVGGPPALAESDCSCFTAEQVDNWYWQSRLPSDTPPTKVLCVDEPGFVTLDYLDRSAPNTLYLDVTYETRFTRAKCTSERSPESQVLMESRREITEIEARACRQQILESSTWRRLGCPNN